MDKKDKYRITNNKSEASFTYNNVCLDPKEQIGLHQQSTWELSYIINGAGLRLIGDIRETFSAGEVVLVPPHIPHCWYFDSNVTDKNGKIANITITFPKELPDEQISLFPEFLEYMRKFNSHTDAIRHYTTVRLDFHAQPPSAYKKSFSLSKCKIYTGKTSHCQPSLFSVIYDELRFSPAKREHKNTT